MCGIITTRACSKSRSASALPLGLVYGVDGLLELGRVGLNNRLNAGGRKKTNDGPFNSVGRRVVAVEDVVVVVVVVEADYLMCFGLLCVSHFVYGEPTQTINCRYKNKNE